MAHEKNAKGNYYCKHLGAACDFQIVGVDSRKVISFIRSLKYDSIYYYGKDSPVHVSWSETPRRKIWEFTTHNTPKPYLGASNQRQYEYCWMNRRDAAVAEAEQRGRQWGFDPDPEPELADW
ncbi:hypothetical protein [Fischerella thermalis]|uniref:Peptidase M15A C-terminal domain-containing protein n=1 Tax=Fischerella thermalis CCMEE 5318 TaxID=2019666 RepID=A0A2N6L3T3_9CYAN|nr:hypothetical protein [Fischerella thermalis]PMB14897.1 hypothetical protein CEN46_26385 [Fischerella thermalis CCMEE 5318]